MDIQFDSDVRKYLAFWPFSTVWMDNSKRQFSEKRFNCNHKGRGLKSLLLDDVPDKKRGSKCTAYKGY